MSFKFRNFVVLSAAEAARYTQTAMLPPAWIYNIDALIAETVAALSYMYSTTCTDEYDLPLFNQGFSSDSYNEAFSNRIADATRHLELDATAQQQVWQACRWAGYK
jgi:hypothetical protein